MMDLRSIHEVECCSPVMAPVWPFTRKKSQPRKAKPIEEKPVINYDRQSEDVQKNKLDDRSHLEDKEFLDAMALLEDK